VLIVAGESPAKVFGASDHEIEHLPIQRVRRRDVSGPFDLSEEPIQDGARIDFGRDGLSC
jgi:hypothetical protein